MSSNKTRSSNFVFIHQSSVCSNRKLPNREISVTDFFSAVSKLPLPSNYIGCRSIIQVSEKKRNHFFLFRKTNDRSFEKKEEKQVFALILISIVTKQKLTIENLCRIQRFCLASKRLCSDLMMSCNINTFQYCFDMSG